MEHFLSCPVQTILIYRYLTTFNYCLNFVVKCVYDIWLLSNRFYMIMYRKGPGPIIFFVDTQSFSLNILGQS